MTFAFVLLLIVNGKPLPWAGFHDHDSCEMVRKALPAAKDVITVCVEPKRS